MKWFVKVLMHYADFKGRARRKEFWMFTLFNSIFVFAAIILDACFRTPKIEQVPVYGAIYFLYTIVLFIPTLAVMVRRLHDTGKSAWMLLVSLIPFAGGIWLLVLMLQNGKPGENKYGMNPKEVAEPEVKKQSNSVAIFLLVSAAVWLFDTITSATRGMYHCDIERIYEFVIPKFAILAPVALLILGIAMMSKKDAVKQASVALIIGSAFWLLAKVYWTIMIELEPNYMGRPLAINLLGIFLPISLLVLGIFLPQKNSKKTVAAIILLVAAGISLFIEGYEIVWQFNYGDPYMTMYSPLIALTSVFYLVLGIHILRKKGNIFLVNKLNN